MPDHTLTQQNLVFVRVSTGSVNLPSETIVRVLDKGCAILTKNYILIFSAILSIVIIQCKGNRSI